MKSILAHKFLFSIGTILSLIQPLYADFVPMKIVTGSDSSCALSKNGEAKCWGDNFKYQLGTGDNYSYGLYPSSMGGLLPKVNLGTDFKISDLCVGHRYACAANTDGKVKCWGSNDFATLGHGNDQESTNEIGDALPYTDLGRNFRTKSLACGSLSVCALTTEGKAKCWGSNNFGELGLGDIRARGHHSSDMGDNLPFLLSQKPITSISAGGYGNFFCFQFDDGVRCVGSGYSGKLGQQSDNNLGDTRETANFDKIPTIKLESANIPIKIRKISSGNSHSCALYEKDNADHIKCWGGNYYGNLGIGSTKNYGDTPNSMGEYLPEVDLGFKKIVDIQAHQDYTCALASDGNVKCWGKNFLGALGIQDTVDRGSSPGQMGGNLPLVNLGLPAKSLSLGLSTHSCAILINNQVKCWGWGTLGQLGYEDGNNRGDTPGDMGDSLPFLNLMSK